MENDNKKNSGLVSTGRLQLLGWGFTLLILSELLVGGIVLWRYNGVFEGLAELVVAAAAPGVHEIATRVDSLASFSISVLLLMIVFGSVVGGALFWNLSRYIRLSALLTDFISDGVSITGEQWRIKSVNHAFARITGSTCQELLNQPLDVVMPGCNAVGQSGGRRSWQCEYSGSRPDGTPFVAAISVFVLSRRRHQPVRSLITIKDITRERESERSVQRLAFYDELTGLANRARLQQRLEKAIARAKLYDHRLALLYLDLDGFKDVNDSLGHEAGDVLLKTMAERFKQALRDQDFVARLGGDEFCVLLEDIESQDQVSRIAGRILKALGEPLIIAERRLKPRASIGVAIFPKDGPNREGLLQAADTAMYAAKRDGKHRVSFYQPELTKLVDLRLSLEHDLRHAIEENEFELFYQPQVALSTGRLVGVEALIRWRHPQRGLVMPDQFIPVAERIGVIDELGEWVLEAACRQQQAWRAEGIEICMAVNISGSHFQQASLLSSVERILEETGIDPMSLELEVTEGVMQVAEQSIENFTKLKQLQVRIAIDDFGTGYSSLSSLKKLPVDHLKVDRAFLQDVLKDRKQAVIIATIVGMAHALEMQVIVEGVETREQVSFLQGLGCNLVQGYYFSRPVSAGEIPTLYRSGYGLGQQSIETQVG